MKKLILKPCPVCKTLVKPIVKSYGGRVLFCSYKCGSYGKFNGNWKGGRRISRGKDRTSGYIRVWVPPNERKHKDCRQREHRLVMEKHIGRSLKKDEIVHHINHNKSDNRIENLEIIKRDVHQRFHVLLRNGKIHEAYESLKQNQVLKCTKE